VIDGQLHRRGTKDQRDVDLWLKANAVFGAIFAVGLVTMALIGSSDSRVAWRTTRSTAAGVNTDAIRIEAGAASIDRLKAVD
jgi:hypothetical protein